MSKKQARRNPSVRLEMPSNKTQQPVDQSEYDYVLADLKHVAILAAAMFALLIALSFFIR